MKLAILYSGRIDNFEKSYEKIMENIVEDNEVDFFISYQKGTNYEELIKFIEKYKPKLYRESDENYFDISQYIEPSHLIVKSKHNMMCMFLNRKYVFELFEKYVKVLNKEYDLIFSCRVDIIIKSKIDLYRLYYWSSKGYISIPGGDDQNGINDKIAVGNYNEMKKYFKCYDSLKYIFDNGGTLHPETCLFEYLILYMRLNLSRFYLDYQIETIS